MHQPIHHLLRRRTFWVVLFTGLFLVSLVIQVNPYPDDPKQWRWPSRPPSPTTYLRWWPALLVLTIFVLLVMWLDRCCNSTPPRHQVWLTLTFFIVAAPLIQVCLVYIHNPLPIVSYLYRTIGPHNGFWQIAIGNDDIIQFLRTYPQQIRTYPFVHTPVHPPGNILYIWLWRRAFQALPDLADPIAHYLRFYNCSDLAFVNLDNDQIACVLAQLDIPLLSGLTVIPLYLFGKQLASSRAALRAVALYVIVPSFTLFTMRWDQLYPLFLCLALYWLHLGLEKRLARFYFLSGLTASVASFASFGNLTIFPALALYGLFYLVSTDLANWRSWPAKNWASWGLFMLGGAFVWLAYQAAFVNSFWDIFSTAMETHIHLGRDYWTWVLLNPYDFLTFLGIPVAVLFVTEGWEAWQRVLLNRGRDVPKKSILALTITGTMLALNISGVARGEVGRMWLLWMPVACLICAIGLENAGRQHLYRLALVLMALQALMFKLFLRVSPTGMPAYQPRWPDTQEPPIAQRVEARFGEEIALLGFDLDADQIAPGDTLHLTLYWQALDRPDVPYTVFVHLLDADEKLWSQQDNMPVRNTIPATCWIPAEFITDPYDLIIAADTPPGLYWLEVGLYWLRTGERLPVSGPNATFPDRVLLGPVKLVEASP